MTTWRKLITATMNLAKDSWDNTACTLTDAELDTEFDDGYGGVEGKSFTVWTETHVYFPICYDGAESCGGVARHPDGVPTEHQGGW